jgi:2-polyprenyl-6-hydroxyphenyl methylase/3-demethylubiquinone-9 3-methyltransferase
MPLGSAIRAMFGPYERQIADLYRALFMDLDDFADKIRCWAPDARCILEVGCGEGAVTEKLATAYPEATILAIDITPRAGRLYRGRRDGVEFRTAMIQEIARSNPGQFDLIIMSDVVHHIPLDLRGEIIDAIAQTMAPGARFIIKDWQRTVSPIHWLCHAGDKWLTGDHVIHIDPVDLERLVSGRVPSLAAVGQDRIRPWRNNYAMVFAS